MSKFYIGDYDNLPMRGKETTKGIKVKKCTCGGRCYVFYGEEQSYHVKCEKCLQDIKIKSDSLDSAIIYYNNMRVEKECNKSFYLDLIGDEYEMLKVEEMLTSTGKVHLYDPEHENKIPNYDENKVLGYKATACGYQRKRVSNNHKKVTCKLCLKIINGI